MYDYNLKHNDLIYFQVESKIKKSRRDVLQVRITHDFSPKVDIPVNNSMKVEK